MNVLSLLIDPKEINTDFTDLHRFTRIYYKRSQIAVTVYSIILEEDIGGDVLHKNFDSLLKSRTGSRKCRLIVAAAHDPHTLGAIFEAAGVFGLEYELIGDGGKIVEIAAQMGRELPVGCVHNTGDDDETARKSVAMAKKITDGVLVKGLIETSTLLRAVVNREDGIRAADTMSHVAFLELPGYHKLVAVTDGGMIQNPSLEQKADIVNNVANLYRTAGQVPKIACLSSSETVSLKFEESVHGARLKEMAAEGAFGDVMLEGPISFDLAISRKAAEKKGYASPICGDVDVFFVPNITVGNVMCKCLIEWAGAKMAGIVLGATLPIVLVSRAASAEEKLNSIALCL